MITFLQLEAAMVDDLVDFLTSETWPLHGQEKPQGSRFKNRSPKAFTRNMGIKRSD